MTWGLLVPFRVPILFLSLVSLCLSPVFLFICASFPFFFWQSLVSVCSVLLPCQLSSAVFPICFHFPRYLLYTLLQSPPLLNVPLSSLFPSFVFLHLMISGNFGFPGMRLFILWFSGLCNHLVCKILKPAPDSHVLHLGPQIYQHSVTWHTVATSIFYIQYVLLALKFITVAS